jgi:DNA-binding MarR family transcriptional regulator
MNQDALTSVHAIAVKSVFGERGAKIGPFFWLFHGFFHDPCKLIDRGIGEPRGNSLRPFGIITAVCCQKNLSMPARTLAGDFSVVTQVMQLDWLLVIASDAMAKPAGQTCARWWDLGAIGRAPASVAQIARTLRLVCQSVQRVADVLVEDGFAVCWANPRHRRAKLLEFTGRGGSALLKTVSGRGPMPSDPRPRKLRSGRAVLTRFRHALETYRPEGANGKSSNRSQRRVPSG